MIFRWIYLAVCTLAVVADSNAQISGTRYNLEFLDSIDHKVGARNSGLHEHIQPFAPGLERSFYRLRGDSVYGGENPTSQLTITVLPQAQAGWQFDDVNKFVGGASIGVNALANISNRFYGEVQYTFHQENLPNYLNVFADSLNVLPGIGYTKRNQAGLYAQNLTGSLAWNAKKYFSFQLGNGKHFWGDGYRSMILSQNAAPYPYFRITTKIWKIKYTNLWSQLRDISAGQDFRHARKKYTASHALSWEVARWLNLSFYETVIWQGKDTVSDRGLDLNYLNPVIFYRPVEYDLGSADNVLMGFSFCIKPSNRYRVYGQLMLDEFLWDEVRMARGWWANKFAVQFGVKIFDMFTPQLNYLTEFNFAKPYTYSHGSVLQNYGHLNQGLAHPLGANFYEWVHLFRYDKDIWTFKLKYIYGVFGRDPEPEEDNSGNYGGNIFRSYKGPSKKYDNYIGQGIQSQLHIIDFRIERPLVPNLDFKAFVGYSFRLDQNPYRRIQDQYLTIGIRSNLIPNYRDF